MTTFCGKEEVLIQMELKLTICIPQKSLLTIDFLMSHGSSSLVEGSR